MINSLYDNLNEKKFKTLTIIFCFISDVFVIASLSFSIGNRDQFDQTMKLVMKTLDSSGSNPFEGMPPNFLSEVWHVIIITTVTIVCVYLLMHSIIYACHHYSKRFARGYIKLYAWSGGVMMGLYAVFNLLTPGKVIFMIPALLLLFVAIGMKRFPETKKKEE